MPALKTVIWVGIERRDLRAFPEPVKDHMGYALYIAQREIEDWTERARRDLETGEATAA